MAAQGLINFPCRKPRALASKFGVSPQKSERTLTSISNFQNAGMNPCARSIMSRPKSPRKRFGEDTETTEGWSNEDLLNELFKLSPHSPTKRSKENFQPSVAEQKNKSPSKKSSASMGLNMVSPTRSILSPIRALTLNSPQRSGPENSIPIISNVDSKRSKVLQLKLSRLDQNNVEYSQKLPHDETPTRPLRNRGKTVAFSERTASRKLLETTPKLCVKSPPRRITRSAKKAQRLKFFEEEIEDDFKENIAPWTLSPSPMKRMKPSPQKQQKAPARKLLLPSTPKKTESTLSPIKISPTPSPMKRMKPKPSPQKQQKAPARKLLLPSTPKKTESTLSPIKISPTKKVKTPEKVLEELSLDDGTPNASKIDIESTTTPRARRVLQLHKPDALVYQHTKRALHSSVPDQLVGREEEISKISKFISSGIKYNKSGSLYISGAPGTGKSACLMKVLADDKVTRGSSKKSKVISINCMSMGNSTTIYSKLAMELGAKSSKCKTVRSAMKYLETALTSEGPRVILLLDEMDQLDSKNQEVLYTIFEWPALENSRLLLIGIANALDLTDRILPRLQSRTKCKPTLINFQPYTKDQIVAILEGRIKETQKDGERVIDTMAVQFCARKVSAVAGDARKALDICRRAVEVVENGVKSQHILSPLGNSKASHPIPKKVGLKQIAGIFSDVYDSSIVSKKPSLSDNCDQDDESFPLQQKLAICTLILLSRHIKCKEVTLGKLHESYGKICQKRQVTAVGQSEFSSLLQLIETRGIISTKSSKQMRLTKVSLALQEKDVEHALQDKTLLSAILQDGLPK